MERKYNITEKLNDIIKEPLYSTSGFTPRTCHSMISNNEEDIERYNENSYNNFRLDNKLSVPEGFVRRNDLPSFNLAQVKRRLKAYHYDIYNQYYTPDGRNRPQDN